MGSSSLEAGTFHTSPLSCKSSLRLWLLLPIQPAPQEPEHWCCHHQIPPTLLRQAQSHRILPTHTPQHISPTTPQPHSPTLGPSHGPHATALLAHKTPPVFSFSPLLTPPLPPGPEPPCLLCKCFSNRQPSPSLPPSCHFSGEYQRRGPGEGK